MKIGAVESGPRDLSISLVLVFSCPILKMTSETKQSFHILYGSLFLKIDWFSVKESNPDETFKIFFWRHLTEEADMTDPLQTWTLPGPEGLAGYWEKDRHWNLKH